jgi:energy-coupling factor transport system ATP-binding protein
MAHIELNNVTFSYPNVSEPAIRNLSLKIEKGEFVVLFGASGSGKSTLLRLLKKEIQPYGNLSGEILINGQSAIETEGQASDIGFVFQDPENQVVAEDVLHELVFGLENIGLSTAEMRARVAEMVHFFGVESLLQRNTHELSGGKKQQINLASVLLMQPNILLLDEPTAQLDPVSSRELLDLLKRINDEFGMTIILAEHRLEEVFTLADQIIMLEKGQVQIGGSPKQVLKDVWDSANKAYVPSIPALFFSMDGHGSVPLTVKEGRNWIRNSAQSIKKEVQRSNHKSLGNEVFQVKKIIFRYDKKADFILKELDFSLKEGEFYALLGGNGSGKSTLLKVLAGLLTPEHGKINLVEKPLKKYKCNEISKIVGYLPQNPKQFFIEDTVEKEIQNTIIQWGITNRNEIHLIIKELDIGHLMSSHPYDLSGGELQKAAIACLLIRKPKILLLDEPTKGLDPISKQDLVKILFKLKSEGVTVLISTHDVEFAAQNATKCGMMFQGTITSEDVPENFFHGNFFYTTMFQRLFREISTSSVKEEVNQCVSTE